MKGISLLVLSSLAGVFSVHDNIVPNSYIVELKPTGKHKRDSTSDAHSDFYNSINVSGIQIQSRHNFTSDLFHGTSFKIEDKHKADIIREFPHVVRMWHVKRYSQPKPVKVELVNSPNEVPKKDRFGPHIMTGVNKLHDHGVLGDGVFVAVVDTGIYGIDYTHPALGGCFGSGCLVFTGRDLVGDKYTGDNDPVPGNDILDCGGHGTHVSGILAANDKSFTGVSPKVRLGGWKVFGCKGTTQSDILIQAFQEAADAGADIISASVGGPSGWSEDAWAVVASRLVDRGVL
ncbi:Minor extracellular protease vpr [Neolecta irregularis DAH-3]|uniref:Minor extracellular protease vpr n=1 Tax=Neolecta irregularis (strain DAH-3) TaxID=1198029 RepID=A0A1U7LLZ5_NEOID|nr:Minor extracellular protease vpr [Neolecta irregularis DAH-3]|eukprot:OLL23686.1 Minor extracellular protease vpr [Neolecta irregularis DAH-3]